MNTPLKTLVIINPIAGTGKQKNIEGLLKKYLSASKFQFCIQSTKYAGHGVELAKGAKEQGYDAVLAVGGDGTVNEIARSLVFSNVALGIIPCGSGNGLARHLGIPMQTCKAIKWINQAKIQDMDTITANEHRFVNVAGIGFDALISHEFAKMGSRGLFSYTRAVSKAFRSFEPQTFAIKCKNYNTVESGMLLSFANSSQFGNNAYIAPSARIDDGKLNLSLLRKPKWYQVPMLAVKVFTKKLDPSPLYSEFIANELTIQQKSNLGHVDGEPVLFGKKIHLKIAPNSLKIFSQFAP